MYSAFSSFLRSAILVSGYVLVGVLYFPAFSSSHLEKVLAARSPFISPRSAFSSGAERQCIQREDHPTYSWVNSF